MDTRRWGDILLPLKEYILHIYNHIRRQSHYESGKTLEGRLTAHESQEKEFSRGVVKS